MTYPGLKKSSISTPQVVKLSPAHQMIANLFPSLLDHADDVWGAVPGNPTRGGGQARPRPVRALCHRGALLHRVTPPPGDPCSLFLFPK